VWLLPSPLSRAALLRPRLARAFARAAGLGLFAGAGIGILSADILGGRLGAGASAGAFAGGGLAATAQAAARWVLCAPGRARLALRLAVLGGAATAAALVAALQWPLAGTLLAASGPWGWATTGIVSAAAGQAAPALTATGLTALCGAAGAWWALGSAGSPPAEELARRAGVGAGAHAAAYFYDVDGLLALRRDALELLRRPPRLHLPAPRRAALAVAWRDATALVRSPGRTLLGFGAAGLAGALAALAAAQAPALAEAASGASPATVTRPLGLAAAAVATGQAAASTLADPLRSALARPFGHAHLPWRHAALVRRHVLVSAGALALGGLGGAVVAAAVAGSGGPTGQRWLAPLAVALAVPLLAASAAHPCLRPPPDPDAAFRALLTETGTLAHSLRGWPSVVTFLACFTPAAVALLAAGQVRPALLGVAAAGWAAVTGGLAWWLLGRRAAPWGG
jgi:hypothetical protein